MCYNCNCGEPVILIIFLLKGLILMSIVKPDAYYLTDIGTMVNIYIPTDIASHNGYRDLLVKDVDPIDSVFTVKQDTDNTLQVYISAFILEGEYHNILPETDIATVTVKLSNITPYENSPLKEFLQHIPITVSPTRVKFGDKLVNSTLSKLDETEYLKAPLAPWITDVMNKISNSNIDSSIVDSDLSSAYSEYIATREDSTMNTRYHQLRDAINDYPTTLVYTKYLGDLVEKYIQSTKATLNLMAVLDTVKSRSELLDIFTDNVLTYIKSTKAFSTAQNNKFQILNTVISSAYETLTLKLDKVTDPIFKVDRLWYSRRP